MGDGTFCTLMGTFLVVVMVIGHYLLLLGRTPFVDAACYYRVAWSVCRSVGLSVTIVSPAESRCHLGYGLGWVQESMY